LVHRLRSSRYAPAPMGRRSKQALQEGVTGSL
jgi:hypothetical protein